MGEVTSVDAADARFFLKLLTGEHVPECRVSAHDTCRVLLPPTGLAQWRQPCCAPVRPAPDRSSATSSARGRPRAAHRPYANGLTAFRMRSACCLRSFGTIAPSPLRQHARAYTYRGLPAFAFALHGRQRSKQRGPECRVSFRDTCGCILCRRDSRTADRLIFAAAALRSERDSTKRPPRPTPPTNGWTACRMPLQIFSAGSGKPTPPPLRKSVRALHLPRTTGLRVALHGRQRWSLHPG